MSKNSSPLAAAAIRLTVFCLLALGPAPQLIAQAWVGGTTLGIEVTDKKGRPIEGAEIRLVFVETEPFSGPGPVATNPNGLGQVVQLASGRWRLDVVKEGFSTYTVVLRLEPGKKPVITAGPVRDAVAPPLTVKLLKSPDVAVPPPVRPDRRQAERQAAPPPPFRPAIREVRPEPAPLPPPPAVTPPPAEPTPSPPAAAPPAAAKPPAEPAPTPPPATVRPAPPPPATQPALAPPPTAVVVPPPPATTPPAPAVTPPPPTVVPAPPSPAPATPPSASSLVQRSETRAFTDPACPGCKAGEWALIVEQQAGPATSRRGCPNDSVATAAAMKGLAAAAGPELATHQGPVLELATGTLREELGSFLDAAAACQLVAVALPPEVRFAGYGYEVRDAVSGGDCQAGQDCSLGECRFLAHPGVEKAAGGTLVWSLFENRSPDRARTARLIVYFKPPSGWRPR